MTTIRPAEGWISLPLQWMWLFGAAGALAAILSLQSYLAFSSAGLPFAWYGSVGLPVAGYFVWAGLSPLLYGAFRVASTVPGRLALSALAALVHRFLALAVYLSRFWIEGQDLSILLGHAKAAYLLGSLTSFLECWILFSAFFAADFYSRYSRQKLEIAMRERAQAQAELRAIRTQLQPHFLFNALNTVSSLMSESVQDAERAIARLGLLLRRTLDGAEATEISLREEMDYVESYLDLERLRFRDRLTVDYALGEGTEEALVPALLLQPLVENAVKHGLSGTAKPVNVRIETTRSNGRLKLTVRDDGSGVADAKAALRDAGFGIRSTVERLALVYPSDHRLELRSGAEGGLVVEIELPYRRSGAAAVRS